VTGACTGAASNSPIGSISATLVLAVACFSRNSGRDVVLSKLAPLMSIFGAPRLLLVLFFFDLLRDSFDWTSRIELGSFEDSSISTGTS
jgi:hypothetical protein